MASREPRVTLVSTGRRGRRPGSDTLRAAISAADCDLDGLLSILPNHEIGLVVCGREFTALHCDVEILRLADHLLADGWLTPDGQTALMTTTRTSDILVFASPTHFSSPNSVFEEAASHVQSALSSCTEVVPRRVVATAITASAREDGGSTATLLRMHTRLLQAGCFISGDGPPGSQAGAALHGRHPGDAVRDSFALDAARRAARSALALWHALHAESISIKPRVVAVAADPAAAARIAALVESLVNEHVTTVDLSLTRILPTLQCRRCPVPGRTGYACVQNDDMVDVHPTILGASLLVFQSFGSLADAGLVRFQRLIERTRYLRRGGFLLAGQAICESSPDSRALQPVSDRNLRFALKQMLVPLPLPFLPSERIRSTLSRFPVSIKGCYAE